VDEFKGMNPKDVVQYIEGEPFVGVVPVEPGLTNVPKEESGQQIAGLNTENAEINEGMIRFDIIFYVRMKDGLSKIIINVEAQRKEPTTYDILNRAVFYVSRLISSQKQRDFIHSNYNDINRVYSIWICMNMKENSLNHIHLTDDRLLGDCQWKGKMDLLNIVFIGLTNEIPKQDEKYELHRLLGTLLASHLSATEKLQIIESEYQIPAENGIRKDVDTMCNLSQEILEIGEARGEARGVAIGEARGVAIGEARGVAIGEARGKQNKDRQYIMNLKKRGLSVYDIADISEKSVEEVEAILEGKEPVLL
jgi:hypothetical protein